MAAAPSRAWCGQAEFTDFAARRIRTKMGGTGGPMDARPMQTARVANDTRRTAGTIGSTTANR